MPDIASALAHPALACTLSPLKELQGSGTSEIVDHEEYLLGSVQVDCRRQAGGAASTSAVGGAAGVAAIETRSRLPGVTITVEATQRGGEGARPLSPTPSGTDVGAPEPASSSAPGAAGGLVARCELNEDGCGYTISCALPPSAGSAPQPLRPWLMVLLASSSSDSSGEARPPPGALPRLELQLPGRRAAYQLVAVQTGSLATVSKVQLRAAVGLLPGSPPRGNKVAPLPASPTSSISAGGGGVTSTSGSELVSDGGGAGAADPLQQDARLPGGGMFVQGSGDAIKCWQVWSGQEAEMGKAIIGLASKSLNKEASLLSRMNMRTPAGADGLPSSGSLKSPQGSFRSVDGDGPLGLAIDAFFQPLKSMPTASIALRGAAWPGAGGSPAVLGSPSKQEPKRAKHDFASPAAGDQDHDLPQQDDKSAYDSVLLVHPAALEHTAGLVCLAALLRHLAASAP